LVLQPEGSLSSTKVLTTKVGLDQGHAPYFVLSLRDQAAREGDSVLFEVIVSAQPAAEILWDKDGDLISDDSAFRVDYFGDGRATLYIPEAFLDDQGYYTCTARNSIGTCRSTARLTVNASSDQLLPTRRQQTSPLTTVHYQQVPSPTQATSSYRVYSQSSPSYYQVNPSATVTQVTEETTVYSIPAHQQTSGQVQHNEISYNVTGQKPQFQPVTFQVSAHQENISSGTAEDQIDEMNPFRKFGAKQRIRPAQSTISSYDETTTSSSTITANYSQQPTTSSSLTATLAKQPGPTLSHSPQQYQTSQLSPVPRESASIETGATTAARVVRASQQTSSSSFSPHRPNFTKVRQ
jgi:hypothetical protein